MHHGITISLSIFFPKEWYIGSVATTEVECVSVKQSVALDSIL